MTGIILMTAGIVLFLTGIFIFRNTTEGPTVQSIKNTVDPDFYRKTVVSRSRSNAESPRPENVVKADNFRKVKDNQPQTHI